MKRYYLLFLIIFASWGAAAQTIAVTSFATGFSNPVEIAHAGDDRLFVVQKTGAIRILNANGTINATPFLTLGPSIIDSAGEQGLLGMAFHPNYATNGYFYVNYTRDGDGATTIARYTVSADANIADPATATVLLTIAQPFSNHNGGSIKFGPDGFLYIGMGDGGGGDDPNNRAQNLSDNLGKMLRIDVNGPAPYGIPTDNPFATTTGNDEIFYYGLRNPWKFSFDRETGDMWIADVGQDQMEEINKLPAPLTPGINLGWRCYEGSESHITGGCPDASTLTMPFAEYPHSGGGCYSITGGYVYRGSLYPNLNGVYLFADYCQNEIGTITANGTLTWFDDLGISGITTFGEDADGELYVVGGNTVYKISDPNMSVGDFARNGIKLYPNPSHGEVFLEAPITMYPVIFTVIDDAGRVVFDEKIEATSGNHFQASDLARGVYVVRMSDKDGNQYGTKLAVN